MAGLRNKDQWADDVGDDDLQLVGKVVGPGGGDSFLVEKFLAAGGWGAVYTCKPTHNNMAPSYALKIFTRPGPDFNNEVHVLRMGTQNRSEKAKRLFVQLFAVGRWFEFRYLVMEYLGPDLGALKREFYAHPDYLKLTMRERRRKCGFGLASIAMLGREITAGLEYLHGLKCLHEDLKPDNVCVGRGRDSVRVKLIDFGKSNQYVDLNGQIRPPAKVNYFRGTFHFGSMASLNLDRQCRRDDFESLIYVLIWLIDSLPWDEEIENVCGLRYREQLTRINAVKKHYMAGQFLKHPLVDLVTIWTLIKSLAYDAEPPYHKIWNVFDDLGYRHRKETIDWLIGGKHYDICRHWAQMID